MGYLARAEGPRWEKQRMGCDNPSYYNLSHTQAALGYQDENVSIATQPPRHKQLKCRTRFRAAASFTVSSTASGDGSRSFDHSSLDEPLRSSNEHGILPFYYIFLFRFTPF
ncbi:hypothetical protein [Paraflavitalea speifideaquila]|uniref:hypothetical protein n=1 Tax=Paraflavitalea speifideaquila TaxID=3076558 RepID=UPI0028E2789B|nr:hypothetical protein [Paraflavitalea speifideiaquila]